MYKINVSFAFPEKINLLPFWFGLIAGLIAAFLTFFFPNGSQFITPITSNYDAIEMVQPRLEEKKNNYKIKKDFSLISQSHASSTYDEASAYAVIDYDSGKIIADKNITNQLPIASLTKVMTAIVALDLVSPDQYFYISKKATRQIPTKIGIVEGQKMNLTELLKASLITSANDATEVIRDGIDHRYRDGVFVEAMNIKAQAIGLKNTRFDNPQGFDSPDNYSTVEDLALLTHYALENYPLVVEIVKKKYAFLADDENHKQYDLYNWNGLIGVYPDTYGVKIGNTGDAGITTIVVSERENKKMIAVVLGAPGILERDMWAADLLDLGYEQQHNLEPVKITKQELKDKYASWKYWN